MTESDTTEKYLQIIHQLEAIISRQEAIISRQEVIISQLEAKILQLENRIAELEAMLKINSSNSNFPSSRDLYPPPKPVSLRKKSGKKVGGQKNHKGVTRQLSATPTSIEVLPLHQCTCGHNLEHQPVCTIIRHQVIDIPDVPVTITEYQAEVKYCPCCKKRISSIFPSFANRTIQFGTNLKTIVTYLKNELFTPYQKISQLLVDIYGIRVSQSTIIDIQKELYEHLEEFETDVKDALLDSPVLHADETGLRVIGKRWWLHSLGNDHLTLYGVNPLRGAKAMTDIGVLPEYTGTLVHDFWNAYRTFGSCSHSYCNQHLVRELQGVYDTYRQDWALQFRELLEKIHVAVSDHTNPNISNFEREYDELLKTGFKLNPLPPTKSGNGRYKQSKARNLLNRLEKYKQDILRFMYYSEVPFTNNQAERDVRMMKVQQKVSGTFRSTEGAEVFCRIRGYLSTVRKNKGSIFEAIKKVIEGNPFTLTELLG